MPWLRPSPSVSIRQLEVIDTKGQPVAQPVDFSVLRRIHHLLRLRAEYKDRINQGPKVIQIAEGAERVLESELEELKDRRRKTQMAADAKQLQLSEREQRIKDLENKRNSAGSNREYQLLNDQIEADRAANAVLSDEILELLERVDEIGRLIEEKTGHLENARSETARVRESVEQQLARTEAELEGVVNEIRELLGRIHPELREEFQRLVRQRGADALASTDLKSCGHCQTMLTRQKGVELMQKKPAFCQSCGSILYPAESAAINQE